MKCVVCGNEMGDQPPPCPRCGQTPAGAPVRSAKLDDHLEELQAEQARNGLEAKERRKRRRLAHAITGAITFFAINTLLGLPMSLKPLYLLINLGVSSVSGFPIGWLISARGGGPYRGAFLSAAAFIVVRLVLSIPDLARGQAGGVIASAFLWGLSGVIPGFLIGAHVDMDD